MAFLYVLSLWTVPTQAVAQNCCQEDECCRRGGGGWWSNGNGRTALMIGGAAVVGGVAGAIVENASSSGSGGKGHKGDRGPRGFTGNPGAPGSAGPVGPAGLPGLSGATGATGATGTIGATGATGTIGATGATGATGSSSFVTDAANSLTFSFVPLDLSSTVPFGPVTAIPFVTYPDGTTVEGNPIIREGLNIITLNPAAITIGAANPPLLIYGTYQVGLNIISPSGTTLFISTLGLGNTVTATRDGSITFVSGVGLSAGPLTTTQTQLINDFTYDSANVP